MNPERAAVPLSTQLLPAPGKALLEAAAAGAQCRPGIPALREVLRQKIAHKVKVRLS